MLISIIIIIISIIISQLFASRSVYIGEYLPIFTDKVFIENLLVAPWKPRT